MTDPIPELPEETRITEITIQPDGRIYVFGASRRALELLEVLQPNDIKLNALLNHVRRLEANGTVKSSRNNDARTEKFPCWVFGRRVHWLVNAASR